MVRVTPRNLEWDLRNTPCSGLWLYLDARHPPFESYLMHFEIFAIFSALAQQLNRDARHPSLCIRSSVIFAISQALGYCLNLSARHPTEQSGIFAIPQALGYRLNLSARHPPHCKDHHHSLHQNHDHYTLHNETPTTPRLDTSSIGIFAISAALSFG